MRLTILSASVRLGVGLCLATTLVFGQGATANFKTGNVDLQSVSQLAFGPNGVLFVGDSLRAALFAIDTLDTKSAASPVRADIKGINAKIAALLGAAPDQILINDVKVNPISQNIYLAVSRGRGPDAIPVILRLDAAGAAGPAGPAWRMTEVSLKN